MKRFFLHLRPKRISEEALKLNITFGLGGILTYLFIIELITGIILMFYYTPSIEKSYFDVKKITYIIPYGYLVRNIHRICGELMIIVAFFHMLRIVLQEAYDTKFRKRNWIYGVFLFLLIFPLNFTGYLLPFDTVSYWGATVVLNVISEIPFIGDFLRILISGSNVIDENVLIRFYVYHIVILPIIFSLLASFHFYYVRISNGVKVKKLKNKVDIFYLFKKELIAVLFITIIILVVSKKFYSAPISQYALNSNIPEIIKAPWYFLNLQFLLKFFSSNIIILFVLSYVILLIFYPKVKSKILFLILHFFIISLIFLFR